MAAARFASALSTRHDGTLALREAAEELREGLEGRSPDLLVAFATPHHAAEFESMPSRLGSLCGARVLLGCGGESLVGRGQEIERLPAISLWGVACEDLELTPLQIGAHPLEGWEAEMEGAERISYSGHPDFEHLDPQGSTLLLFGDPFSFPMSDYLELLDREAPGLEVIGGMTSGASSPGESALFLADRRLNTGAVGVLMRGGLEVKRVQSQAYRPVGSPWVITDCEGPLVKRLGGKPASQVMMRTFDELPEEEKHLLQQAPMMGVAWDASKREFTSSDLLAQVIRGVAPQEEAVLLFGEARRGQTIQFMIRDPRTAGQDLLEGLERGAGPAPGEANEAGALLFTCNGRGSRMFVEPNHDVARVHAHLGPELPTAGFFAQGEIGRVGGHHQLHGFTASVAVFRGQEA